ncbi:putative quinol monooxygenase [Umezawaea endophytica]|uniref:Antibiotic biosynthesis monooxygenase n=1 Tax=Umezawaea endophytica TaxID=1654476 RepID=A0A9X2VWE2_9PSEU|nr:antibiotic biosynthesis monooxygenase family protein [Umezawaea endophytica]MCS7482933.1 antibiotic biosynthesis monooxygenase [Umezawaea endophytica]
MNARKTLATGALLALAILTATGCGAADAGEQAAPSTTPAQDKNPDTVTVLIEIHAKPGQEQEARDGLLHAINTSEKPGFLGSHEYEAPEDPGAFYAVQEWENMEAFRQHMADAAAGNLAEATSMLREPPKTAVLRTIK